MTITTSGSFDSSLPPIKISREDFMSWKKDQAEDEWNNLNYHRRSVQETKKSEESAEFKQWKRDRDSSLPDSDESIAWYQE